MAFFAQTLTHGDVVTKQTIVTANSGAEILLGANARFLVTANGPYHIKFGVTGMAAAAATDTYFPNGSIAVWDMGRQHTAIRIFNDSGGDVDVYVTVLST